MIFGFHLFCVTGDSMLPTLCEGDYLLVRDYSIFDQPLLRGDIVVITFERCEQSMLKRVVGLPQERIVFTDGSLLVNGERLTEPYLHGLPPYLGLDDSGFMLGKDDYFVMGDNRAHSTDSREYGPVRHSQIEGRVVCRVWPLSRVDRL